jgi:DNA-binding MarR family transcriptional regulator
MPSFDSPQIKKSGGPRVDTAWEEIVAVNHLLRREMSRIFERRGILLSEYRALRIIENGPDTLGNVSRQLGLTPATLTTLARGLEKRGWVHRTRSSTDRRASLLKATPKGLRVLRQAQKAARVRMAQLERGLLPTGSERLTQDLHALRVALEQMEKEVH